MLYLNLIIFYIIFYKTLIIKYLYFIIFLILRKLNPERLIFSAAVNAVNASCSVDCERIALISH